MTETYEGELSFNYEKGTYFRVIHADGVVGGISSGTGLIHMSIFSERNPIPKKVVHPVSKGVLGPEILERREVREGIFREIEADVVMSMELALSMRAWLDDKIKELMVYREVQVSAMESARDEKA